MFFCWSLLSPHRSNSDIISCCLRFVKNFFQLFYFFFFDLNNTEKEGFEPSRRFNTTYTLSRGASSASWVFLLNYFQSIWCLRLTAHFLLYSCVLWLSRTFFFIFQKTFLFEFGHLLMNAVASRSAHLNQGMLICVQAGMYANKASVRQLSIKNKKASLMFFL